MNVSSASASPSSPRGPAGPLPARASPDPPPSRFLCARGRDGPGRFGRIRPSRSRPDAMTKTRENAWGPPQEGRERGRQSSRTDSAEGAVGEGRDIRSRSSRNFNWELAPTSRYVFTWREASPPPALPAVRYVTETKVPGALITIVRRRPRRLQPSRDVDAGRRCCPRAADNAS